MSEIKISKDIWGSINDKDKNEITSILKNQGLLAETDIIIADNEESNAATTESFSVPNVLTNPMREVACKAVCNITFETAKAACIGLENPLAIAACMVASEEARKECRRRC